MEFIMKADIDLEKSGLDPDKVKGNLAQFVRDLLIIGAVNLKIGVTPKEASLVETDGETQETDGEAQETDGEAQETDGEAQETDGEAQETDDLISKKAVVDAIEELLQSPYVNDSYFTGRKEAIEMARDMCVKSQPSAYDATKAKERIKEEIGTCDFRDCGKYYGNCDACREGRAMEIVKSGYVR